MNKESVDYDKVIRVKQCIAIIKGKQPGLLSICKHFQESECFWQPPAEEPWRWYTANALAAYYDLSIQFCFSALASLPRDSKTAMERIG